MLWPLIIGALIGTLVLAGSTQRSNRMWSSPRIRNSAMVLLVAGFVLAASLRLVLWQYLVLILTVFVSATGLGFAMFRAYTRRRWKLLTSLLLVVILVPL